MSWKKNVLSYPIWFFYTFITGSVLSCMVGMVCANTDISAYAGAAMTTAYGACVGGVVYLLYCMGPKMRTWAERRRSVCLVIEASLVVALLTVGICLRVDNISAASDPGNYYEAAKITMGQGIPNRIHGADYLYLQALHLLFMLVGNHFIAGIWLQIILQMIASFCLYFVVKRLAGSVAGFLTLGFLMCGPYMIHNALVLSPIMLYFFLFVVGLNLITTGFQKRLRVLVFLPIGIFISLFVYLDIIGILLLAVALAVVFCTREERVSFLKKINAALLCILGFGAGFAGCIFADACLSGSSFFRVLSAWSSLYVPERFGLSFTIIHGISIWECLVVVAFMIFAVFSFWCSKEQERISPVCLLIFAVAAAGCFGIFTEEMPGNFTLYILAVIIASVSISQAIDEKDQSETSDAAKVQPDINMQPDMNIHLEVQSQPEVQAVKENPIADVHEVVIEEAGQVKEQESMQELENMQEKESVQEQKSTQEKPVERKVDFIPNPLPLPKKHEKRKFEYAIEIGANDDFDINVSESDDFDI